MAEFPNDECILQDATWRLGLRLLTLAGILLLGLLMFCSCPFGSSFFRASVFAYIPVIPYAAILLLALLPGDDLFRGKLLVVSMLTTSLAPFITWRERGATGNAYFTVCIFILTIASIFELGLINAYFMAVAKRLEMNRLTAVSRILERVMIYCLAVPVCAEHVVFFYDNERSIANFNFEACWSCHSPLFVMLHYSGGIFCIAALVAISLFIFSKLTIFKKS